MDNKKKKFNTNRVAAYALSGVMLASVIPYNVFANQEKAEEAAKQTIQLQNAQTTGGIATIDAAAPEDTSTSSDAKDAVHGFVGVLVGGDINANLKAETGQRFKPIEGVKVYFQWYEAKGNRTSPTYYATSGADGQFHIKMKPYIGEDGKLVKFDADTTISAGSESYKMWVDESTIPDGYQLQYSTGEGVEFTDRRVAGGGYQLGPNRLVNYRVLLMEKQDEAKMHKEATPTGDQIYGGSIGQGAVRGKVSWDYESAGGVQWGIVSTPTSPAEEVTVTASYLSDYALKQIYSPKTANMLGLSKPSDIRGSGWTFKLETQLQDWIAKQVAADKDNWIAETVSAKTNAEGDYKIQFKGTWGPHRNTSAVAEYTREAGKYYVGDAHKWTEVEAKRLGTVAENAKDGSFLTGALDWNEKHVNSDWLFISTKDTDDVVKRTPWNYNWYTGSDNAWGIHGGWAQAAFGVSTVQAANSIRADFNFAPAEIKFNITNFDTQENTAVPGDVATTNTQGLPHKNASDSFKIVWYDQDGNKIKEEPTQKPTSTGALAEATYDTSKVTETSTFIAKLHYVDSKGKLGQVLAQDAFTVKVNDKIGSLYEDVEFSNGETENATYAAKGLPKGLTIDEATGKVTGNPTEAGKFTVTTTISVPADDKEAEDISVDKTDDYIITDSPLKDGEVDAEYSATIVPTPIEGYVFDNVSAKFIDGKEIDGLTIDGDKISGTPTSNVEATQEDPNVEVTYDVYQVRKDGTKFLIKEGHVDKVPLSIKDGEATKYEPAYKEVNGKVGEEATVAKPTFSDKEGNPATPEGKVSYEKGKDAPEGATVNEDGSVTYTPSNDDVGKTVEIPVTVKYSDGTTDDAVAKIKVADPQNMDYEPEYAETNAKAGEDATSTPKFKDADGADTEKPEGAKFELGAGAPEGADVDETTGVVTYNPNIDKAGNTVKVPVTVTYKDGSTDKVEAPFKVAEADNSKYTPEYKPVTAQVGHEVTVASPEFHDKDGNKAEPEVQKFEMGTAVKEGDEEATPVEDVTIDENTGEIKYTAKDADKDSVIEVPVTVTYKDGSKGNTIARINVPSDADFYNPEGKPLETEKGTLPKAEDGIKDKDKLPEGTKYAWEIEPKVDEAGETSGVVKITYPDGSTDKVGVPVTVTDSEASKTTVDGTPKEVEPNGEAQDTGLTIKNQDEETPTTVTAKDEDKNDVTVKVDPETGKITVTPSENVDGPITVTVKDDDFITEENPTGEKTFEVPVKGHTKDVDDNGSETPADKKTSVDDSGKKPVNPTDEKQDTGVKVTNPDKDTKVTAKDEDGKDVPAEIDGNGNVVVTPGTDVDGPIDVTITDPDLPDGKVEVEVPVNGHEKDRDDNGSETDPEDKKTEVTGEAKPVDPTDEKQDTGIVVTNPDKDTKISAKDEDGKDLPVEIDKDGKVIVTPGEDVDGPITVVVEDPELPGGKVEVEVPVIGHEKDRDDNNNGKPSDKDNTGGNDGYRPGHGGSDVFDRLFRRHDYTPTYPVKTVVPEKTEVATPVRDTLWYVFHINEFEYEVVRNGVVTKRLMDVTPVLKNGRTMLPLRYVAEALQADVTWDAKTRTATFTRDGLTASIQIDSDEIVLSNGKTVKMDSKPLNINDRILVSVTNVANVFGLTNGNTQDKIDQDIEWEQEDKSATIYIRR